MTPLGRPRGWRAAALGALVVLTAGYMAFDGARALLLGDYVTIDGQLGPWAALVEAVGVDPRGVPMKIFFVAYGAAWLVALGLHLAGRAGRRVMLAFAIGALWYLVIGTVAAAAQIALLATARDTQGA